MAINSFRDMKVVEERQFTNPRVRFIRRRGRIIPIVNKRRIGGELNRAGASSLKTGVTIGATSLVASTLKKKSPGFKMSSGFKSFIKTRPISKDISSTAKRFQSHKFGKTSTKVASGGFKIAKTVLKNPKKIAFGFIAAGLGMRAVGTELELSSSIGLDL